MAVMYILFVAAIVCLAEANIPEYTVVNAFNCKTMWPLYGLHHPEPQIMPSPFQMKFTADVYKARTEIPVNLTAPIGRPFRTFIIQARKINKIPTVHQYIGRFTNLNKELVETVTDCDGHGIKSYDNKPKELVSLVWAAPPSYHGHIEFRVTFLEDRETFWVFEKSAPILDYDIVKKTGNLPPPAIHLIDAINTDGCGTSKGCFREPEGCEETACLFIVTWNSNKFIDDDGTKRSFVDFEIGAVTDGLDDRYVAVGLSGDKYMGNDYVMACVHNSANSHRVEVLQSFNTNDKFNGILTNDNGNKAGIMSQEGSYYNGRLRCRFTKDINLTGDKRFPSLAGKSYHLLLARGSASAGNLNRHGLTVGDFPQVSPDKINFERATNIDGHARYHLVKAHGCLMILAWIFFATIGLILTKYYKRMWPNSRLFGLRYWFVGHFNCMTMCFICVLIGFILIVIEAEGYTQAPDLPQRAHPILGIIIFICVIINPLIALIRPDEESWWRPCFNWIHFIFGFVANVLSIPTIFIGLDFGKANVPWWATWILVIYVIFHLIVELSLEIHGCCMYKKDKKRMQKYEMQKRESSKPIPEPEPAGRRFKQNMLTVHLIVTTIVSLLMIIIIAVC